MSYNSKYTGAEVEALLDDIPNKVDAEADKRLMTDVEGTKLNGIQAGAQVNPGNATTSAAGLMSSSDKAKLNGLKADPTVATTLPSSLADNTIYNLSAQSANITIASTTGWGIITFECTADLTITIPSGQGWADNTNSEFKAGKYYEIMYNEGTWMSYGRTA